MTTLAQEAKDQYIFVERMDIRSEDRYLTGKQLDETLEYGRSF